MRALLDTHALLWFALSDSHLSSTSIDWILDPANVTLVSPASYWEIAIKISTGKYVLSHPYRDFMRNAIDKNGFRYLHIKPRHTEALIDLPYHHRDPFDRLLAAQAIVERIPIISNDVMFDAYAVRRIW